MKITKILLILIAFAACKEDEIDLFSGQPAINMAVITEKGYMDTTRHVSFGFMGEKTLTVEFVAKLEGVPVDYDRTITFRTGGDAIYGTDYTMDTLVALPAGAHEIRIPCHITSNASLVNNNRTIIIESIPDGTFIKGFQQTAQIVISDGMPNQWIGNGSAWSYLGVCSRAKYRFFYDMLGFYDLSNYRDDTTIREIASYMRQKLNAYNTDPEAFDNKYGETPMRDENGRLIVFDFEMPEDMY